MNLEDKDRVRSLGLQIELAADSLKMSGQIINRGGKVDDEDELKGEMSRIDESLAGLLSFVSSIKRIMDPEETVKLWEDR